MAMKFLSMFNKIKDILKNKDPKKHNHYSNYIHLDYMAGIGSLGIGAAVICSPLFIQKPIDSNNNQEEYDIEIIGI